MDLLTHEPGEPETASPKPETRGRPKKVCVICDNIRKASFTTEKGERVRPGERAEVPAKLAKTLVENGVARYEIGDDQ